MRQLQMQEIERQTLDYSCGAAALAILLRLYFGHPLHDRRYWLTSSSVCPSLNWLTASRTASRCWT